MHCLLIGVGEDVRQGIIWNLGDGSTVGFWYDPWLTDVGPSIALVSNSLSILSCSIAAMVSDNGERRWSLFESLLPVNVLLRIAAVMPPPRSSAMEVLGWKWMENRSFTAKFAY
ncbi:hypothetical protein V6N13_047995 [Hibiscus sabdariffa]